MSDSFIFTSDAVTAGHPDKLSDRISDALVASYLQQDSASRVTAECAVSTGIVFLAVKMRSRGTVDAPFVARRVIESTGYGNDDFDARNCTVMTSVGELPTFPDWDTVDGSVDAERDRPALNNATVFGFACRQTESLMPLPIVLAHELARRVAEASREQVPELSPDGTAQVAVEFRERRPARIHGVTVLATLRRTGALTLEQVHDAMRELVIAPTFEGREVVPDEKTRIDVNPEGLVLGGPSHHTGLTGRKNADDTYGAYARHGSAALSGKDPSRIDRVGAYASRWAAKHAVAAELAEDCEVVLSYAIGQASPVSVQVRTFGTGAVGDEEIARRLSEVFDFRPAAVVEAFELRELPGRHTDGFLPRLAAYGHVGREELDLPWERLDRVDALR